MVDGLDVDGHDAVEFGFCHVEGGFVFVAGAGIVDEDVDATEFGGCRGDLDDDS